jgi:hypothetical protein
MSVFLILSSRVFPVTTGCVDAAPLTTPLHSGSYCFAHWPAGGADRGDLSFSLSLTSLIHLGPRVSDSKPLSNRYSNGVVPGQGRWKLSPSSPLPISTRLGEPSEIHTSVHATPLSWLWDVSHAPDGQGQLIEGPYSICIHQISFFFVERGLY